MMNQQLQLLVVWATHSHYLTKKIKYMISNLCGPTSLITGARQRQLPIGIY